MAGEQVDSLPHLGGLGLPDQVLEHLGRLGDVIAGGGNLLVPQLVGLGFQLPGVAEHG